VHQIIPSQIGIKIHKNVNLPVHVVGESSFEFQCLNKVMKGDGNSQEERNMTIRIILGLQFWLLPVYICSQIFLKERGDQAALAEPVQKPSASPCPFSAHGNRFSSNVTIFTASVKGIISGHAGSHFLKQLLEGEGQDPRPSEHAI